MIAFLVWSWMHALSPASHNPDFARAVAVECAAAAPLFRHDTGERCAALMTAIAFRETDFRHGVRGDHGDSRCELQIKGDNRVEGDVYACVRVGIARVRESMALCPKGNELCVYAAGPRGLNVSEARVRPISVDRMALAAMLLRTNGRTK